MKIATGLTLTLALLAGATTGCATDQSVPSSVCKSQMQWSGGNEGSPLMSPGTDCIGCHAGGEGPSYAIAGTVYGDWHQSDDCYGEQGAKVVLTGADGKVFSLSTNGAGNFFMDTQSAGQLKLPYTAKVIVGGKEKVMITPQSIGSCNTCHTKAGANAAPGRIVIP